VTPAEKIAALLRDRGAAYAQFDDSATDGQCWIVETKDWWYRDLAGEILALVQADAGPPKPAAEVHDDRQCQDCECCTARECSLSYCGGRCPCTSG
jgi:hypothetical protein